MRTLFAAAAACLAIAALAPPAQAGTYEEIIAHGMVVTIADMDIDLSFTPDGKWTGMAGQLAGTWRIDGEKLCTTSNLAPEESCAVYPKDKKSGDVFEVSNELGSAKVRIK